MHLVCFDARIKKHNLFFVFFSRGDKPDVYFFNDFVGVIHDLHNLNCHLVLKVHTWAIGISHTIQLLFEVLMARYISLLKIIKVGNKGRPLGHCASWIINLGAKLLFS